MKNITCNFFLGDGKKKKKKMNSVFIPSNGIGEIRLESRDLYWYMLNSSYFNINKKIPFFKLLIDMTSLCMRYFKESTLIEYFYLKL